MFLSNSFKEDESTDFEHWNNWEPPEGMSMCIKTNGNKNFTYSDQKFKPLRNNPKFSNWIPPRNFKINNKNSTLKRVLGEESHGGVVEELKNKKLNLLSNPVVSNLYKWKKVVNEDWGVRAELHDVSKYEDGNMVWGFVSLSSFTCIKLEVNNYNNICGYASGTLLKPGSSEKSFILVNELQLLRKLLNLTNSQWLSLCDAVKALRACLKMETFKEIKESELNSLEKCWFFICNRRHFYPKQSMLVMLDGALKSMKDFEIMPKLVVQDIRNTKGQEIL